GAVGLEGEGVVVAGGDRRHVRQVGDLDRAGAVGERPVAELTEAVPAPGPDGAVGPQRGGVAIAAGDRYRAGDAGDLDREADAGGGGDAVADLAVGVVAPGPDGA